MTLRRIVQIAILAVFCSPMLICFFDLFAWFFTGQTASGLDWSDIHRFDFALLSLGIGALLALWANKINAAR